MFKTKKFLVTALLIGGVFYAYKTFHNPTDLTKNSVMIVNKAMNSGGTGVIYASGKSGSYVLTNRHVCEVVKNGGVVRTTIGDYQVSAYVESEVSDLCMIYLPADLNQNTKFAYREPKVFSPSKVVGHPALMPTIISTGHFSHRQIITIMTGTRACTDADLEDPVNKMYCMFFGVVPVLKSYDSQLVSSTIMPGSSGSGVYNDKNELSGVVFAGQGDFGYGWIVTYDQVKAFLDVESQVTPFTNVDQTLGQRGASEGTIKDMVKKCSNGSVEPVVLNICKVLKRDLLWNK